MNILVTSIGRRVQLIYHLKQSFTVIGVDASEQNAAKAFVDEFYVIPRYDSGDYIYALKEICVNKKVSLLIPLHEGEFSVLCENRDVFAEIGTQVVLSDLDIIDICNDKTKTQKFFESEGIMAPRYTNQAPAVLKPVHGMGSQGVFKVCNDAELEAAKVLSKEAYIIQEYVRGIEYTIDVLCDFYGNVVAVVPRVRLEVRQGEVSKSKTVKQQKIIDETVKLIEKLNQYGTVRGPMTIQCFLTPEGMVVFLEINPRFGGGVPLTFEAGVNYGAYLKAFADGYQHNGCLCDFEELTMFRYDMAVYTPYVNEN